MTPEELKAIEQMDDSLLFALSAEREGSQRRQAAMHFLELRRNEPLRKAAEASVKAAQESARATRWAVVAAFISAIAAVIGLIR